MHKARGTCELHTGHGELTAARGANKKIFMQRYKHCLLGESGLSWPGGAAQRVEGASRTSTFSGLGLGIDPQYAGSRSGDLI